MTHFLLSIFSFNVFARFSISLYLRSLVGEQPVKAVVSKDPKDKVVYDATILAS